MLIGRVLKRLLKTHHPRFVFGLPLITGEVPVFVYHEVEAKVFAADLEFLRRNGYRTISTEEYVRSATGRASAGKAVLLTFDDARRNFYEVVLPTLREFSAHATLFVPTLWVDGRRNEASNCPTGTASLFMTWNQIHECLDSGLVDVHSHGHRHALIYTSERLIGFVTPTLLARHHIYDWPMRRVANGNELGWPPLGTPVYASEPLLSAKYRLLEDEAVSRACQEIVKDNGGDEFFKRSDWRMRLKRVYQAVPHRMELTENTRFKELVASEFALSQEFFLAELGTRPRFFAFPWMLGSPLALDLTAAHGFEAVFGVGIDFGRINRIKGPLPAFIRWKKDWLRFLPGSGRHRLRDVIPEKFKEFFSSQHLAH